MDVSMPGMSGLEATRLIRMLPVPRGVVPVIALTAQAFAEQVLICHKAGMNTHVSKPFRQEALLTAVEAMVPARVSFATTAITAAAPPLITASASAEPMLPVSDRARLRDSTKALSPEKVEQHLRTLIARTVALLGALRSPGIDSLADELAATAHIIAGGAGMFGFLFLADAAHRFEFAEASAMPEAEALAEQLATAIDATAPIMQRELADLANIMKSAA
jgi:CheY-like chemotaxis protein